MQPNLANIISFVEKEKKIWFTHVGETENRFTTIVTKEEQGEGGEKYGSQLQALFLDTFSGCSIFLQLLQTSVTDCFKFWGRRYIA